MNIKSPYTYNKDMKKSTRVRKTLRIIVLILGIILCFGALFCIVSFMSITSGRKLDNTKLEQNVYGISLYNNLGEKIESKNQSIEIEMLSQNTKNCFIAKEDKRFYKHNGYDIIRIFGAIKNNILSKGNVEGGSTISQQLIKNTHTEGEKTLERKMIELRLATELEEKYSKDEILEMYLNTIYFGNNCYGIADASLFYFNKNANELNLAESSILAGLLTAPSVFNPIANIDLSKEKAKLVLKLMQEQKYISEEERVNTEKELEVIKINNKGTIGKLYMANAILEACKILGIDELPENKNVEIKTYMDEDLQRRAEELIESNEYNIANKNGYIPSMVTIVLDNETGGILAFAGESKYNLRNMRRQPASCIKPILVYGPAIEYDLISPSTFILDEPIDISGYSPHNATNMYYGWTTVRDNLIRSTNVPAVKVLQQTGIERSKMFANRCGINFSKEDGSLALALGGFNEGTEFLELAESYMTLANEGEYQRSKYVKSISFDGNIVWSDRSIKQRVMRDSTAYLLTDILKDTAQIGTARKLNALDMPIASKTGSNATDDNNLDAWNVAYTTEHTYLCWIGNTDGTSGTMNKNLTSSTMPTLVVKELCKEAYSEHKPKEFTMPSSVIRLALDKESYEKFQLYLADNQASEGDKIYELFARSNIPSLKSDVEKQNIMEILTQMNLYLQR